MMTTTLMVLTDPKVCHFINVRLRPQRVVVATSKGNNLTVWKIQDFSIPQILREINFGDCTSVKSAILTHLEACNFDVLCIFALFEG